MIRPPAVLPWMLVKLELTICTLAEATRRDAGRLVKTEL